MKKWYFLTSAMLVFAPAFIFAGSNEKGIDYYRAELYGAAKIFFLSQTGQTPAEKAENYYYLGQTYYRLEQNDSARYYYDLAVQTDPEYPFGYVGQGSLELVAGNLKPAEELFKKATNLAKKDPSVPTTIAETFVAQDKYDKAADALGKARKIDKLYSGIYITEGDMLMKQGKVGEANALYDNAILFNPNDKVAYLKCAQVYKHINPSKSLEYLDKLLAIDPNYIPAYAEIGDINRSKGNDLKDLGGEENEALADECFAKAQAAYEKFISIPGVPLLQQERYAQLLFFTKQYDKAEAQINSVLEQDANNSVMHRIRAYNNFALGKNDLALEQLTAFLTTVPVEQHLFVDYTALGDIYLTKRQYEEAEKSYQKALKIDETKTINLYAKLIKAADEAKDYPVSIGFWEKYFEINPDFQPLDLFEYGKSNYFAAATYLKDSVVVAEQTDAALAATNEQAFKIFIQKGDKAFADMIVRKPDLYYGYQWRADLNALVDSYNQARKKTVTFAAKPYYEEAIKFNLENNAEGKRTGDIKNGYQYLAKYYIEQNDVNSCIDIYKKILEVDPDDAGAKATLQKLTDHQKKVKAQQAARAAAAAQGN
jgi:tetratricopeptide (TPR) repeat protein